MQVLSVKPALKEALQAEVGLPVDPSVPLLAFIGRLEEQKGSDILSESLEEILKENVQLVVLVSIFSHACLCLLSLWLCLCSGPILCRLARLLLHQKVKQRMAFLPWQLRG